MGGIEACALADLWLKKCQPPAVIRLPNASLARCTYIEEAVGSRRGATRSRGAPGWGSGPSTLFNRAERTKMDGGCAPRGPPPPRTTGHFQIKSPLRAMMNAKSSFLETQTTPGQKSRVASADARCQLEKRQLEAKKFESTLAAFLSRSPSLALFGHVRQSAPSNTKRRHPRWRPNCRSRVFVFGVARGKP